MSSTKAGRQKQKKVSRLRQGVDGGGAQGQVAQELKDGELDSGGARKLRQMALEQDGGRARDLRWADWGQKCRVKQVWRVTNRTTRQLGLIWRMARKQEASSKDGTPSEVGLDASNKGRAPLEVGLEAGSEGGTLWRPEM